MGHASEIGGYFGLEEYRHGEEYHKNKLAFNRGRCALEFILENRGIKKIFVPDYSCKTIFEACDKIGIEVIRYDIDDKLMPEGICAGVNDVVYITNYFGQLSSKDIKKYKLRFGKVILDNVQSFFDEPVKGTDTIWSCRKYFGVPDGAYLYTNDVFKDAYNSLPADNSADRYLHIIGRVDSCASDYYSASRVNEEMLDVSPVRKMSTSTRSLMRSINYELVERIRRENFSILHEKLSLINKLEIRREAGLFAYPLYIENGIKLKEYLNSKKIYTPTLWPELRESGNARSVELTNNIVPLPIDQRYRKEEMEYIVSSIYSFIKTNGESK